MVGKLNKADLNQYWAQASTVRANVFLKPCVCVGGWAAQGNPYLPSHACTACAYMLKSMGFVAFTRTDQSYITAHLSISIRIYTIPTPGNQLLQTELIKRTEKRTPSSSHMLAQACSHSVEYSLPLLVLLINLHFYFCSLCLVQFVV